MRSFMTFLLIFILISCTAETKDMFYGAKIYNKQQNYKKLFTEWEKLGFNTVFASKEILEIKEFQDLAKENQIKTFLISPIFYNPEFLSENPEYYSIDQNGEKAIDEWVHFVCPNREDYLQQKISELKSNILKCNPDVVSLDFIRYFAFWEKFYPDRNLESIPNTCFCSECIKKFKFDYNVEGELNSELILVNFSSQWSEFKQKTITNVVKKITTDLKKKFPYIKFNLHVVPWRAEDFDKAQQKIVAQNLEELQKYVDYISPMVYSHMVKQDADWITDVVKEMTERVSIPVIPSIQVSKAYLESDVSIQEFEDCLSSSLKGESRGVIFWNWKSLNKYSDKLKIVKRKFMD